MPQRTLRFKIRQDGLVEESVEGVAGEACHQLTKRLEDSLGVVQRREPTSELFLKDNNVQSQSLPVDQLS